MSRFHLMNSYFLNKFYRLHQKYNSQQRLLEISLAPPCVDSVLFDLILISQLFRSGLWQLHSLQTLMQIGHPDIILEFDWSVGMHYSLLVVVRNLLAPRKLVNEYDFE